MGTRSILLKAGLVLTLGAGGCGESGQGTGAGTQPVDTALPPAPAPKYGSMDISMKELSYHPPKVTVHEGDTVTWANDDTVDHTATAESGADFDSGTLAPGEKFDWKAKTGAIAYHCTIHPEMTGTMKVKP